LASDGDRLVRIERGERPDDERGGSEKDGENDDRGTDTPFVQEARAGARVLYGHSGLYHMLRTDALRADDHIPRAQDQLFDRRTSARDKYTALVVAARLGGAHQARADHDGVAERAGAWARAAQDVLPSLLGACGSNVVFGQNVILRHPHKVRIGDNVVIDDNCLIDAKGDSNRGITIGSGVFWDATRSSPARTAISKSRTGQRRVQLRDLLASQVRVGREALLAAYCYLIGGDHDFTDPAQPVLAQARRSVGISVGAGAWLGAGAKVLDGVEVGERAIVGGGRGGARRRTGRIDCGRHTGTGDRSAMKLNVLQVCDHLGWEGSRMHGVKRLFAWMIPRFDPERYNVSLVSLRKKDLSEETLESFGSGHHLPAQVEVRPVHPAGAAESDRPQEDRHPAPSRLRRDHVRPDGGAMRRLPTILHEHANLTDTPWFQKAADAALEPVTDIAIAVSRSTPDSSSTRGRFHRESQGRVSRRAARGVQPRPARRGGRARARELGIAPGDSPWHRHAAARLKGNSYLVDAARLVLNERPHARFFIVGEGPLRQPLENRRGA
jgi:acetyltransferase-like isoleucine patch superfamily enzyme